jgi:hypothetical protein
MIIQTPDADTRAGANRFRLMPALVSWLSRIFRGRVEERTDDRRCGTVLIQLGLVRSRFGIFQLRDGRLIDFGAPEMVRVHDALDGTIGIESLDEWQRLVYAQLSESSPKRASSGRI